jgi:hypothetical protein
MGYELRGESIGVLEPFSISHLIRYWITLLQYIEILVTVSEPGIIQSLV